MAGGGGRGKSLSFGWLETVCEPSRLSHLSFWGASLDHYCSASKSSDSGRDTNPLEAGGLDSRSPCFPVSSTPWSAQQGPAGPRETEAAVPRTWSPGAAVRPGTARRRSQRALQCGGSFQQDAPRPSNHRGRSGAPAASRVSGRSLFVKNKIFLPNVDRGVKKKKKKRHKDVETRIKKKKKIEVPLPSSALSADLTSPPSRLWDSPRDFVNSREIYRQPSSWGCWEPGRPPESFSH